MVSPIQSAALRLQCPQLSPALPHAYFLDIHWSSQHAWSLTTPSRPSPLGKSVGSPRARLGTAALQAGQIVRYRQHRLANRRALATLALLMTRKPQLHQMNGSKPPKELRVLEQAVWAILWWRKLMLRLSHRLLQGRRLHASCAWLLQGHTSQSRVATMASVLRVEQSWTSAPTVASPWSAGSSHALCSIFVDGTLE